MHACIAIKYHATRNNWPKFFVSLHLHKAAHRLASPCIQSNLILGRDKVHLGAKNFDPECMYVKGRILIYTSGCVETLTSLIKTHVSITNSCICMQAWVISRCKRRSKYDFDPLYSDFEKALWPFAHLFWDSLGWPLHHLTLILRLRNLHS